MTQKTCRDCNETKTISEFWKRPTSKDGRHNRCKTCQQKARNPNWKPWNPENFNANLELAGSGLRRCYGCHETLPVGAFGISNHRGKGFDVRCRKCSAVRRKFVRSQNPLTYLLKDLHCRSKAKGVPFNLTVDYLTALREQQPTCQITGLEFRETPKGTKATANPFGLSVDRIVPERGYTLGNVRFVLWAVNCGMSTWGEATYLAIAENALPKRPTK